jgi:hypothetical protein
MNHSSQHSKLTPLLAVLKVLLAVLLSVSTTVSGMNLPPRETSVLEKNRVWEIFASSTETHLAKPAVTQQPQREIAANPTKLASGVLFYANGNPAMFTDPSGRVTLGEASFVIGALIATTGTYFTATTLVRNYKTGKISINAKIQESINNNITIRMLEVILEQDGNIDVADELWGRPMVFQNIGSIGVAAKDIGSGKYISEQQKLRNLYEEIGNPSGWSGAIHELIARVGTLAFARNLTNRDLNDGNRATLAEALLDRQMDYAKWLLKNTF